MYCCTRHREKCWIQLEFSFIAEMQVDNMIKAIAMTHDAFRASGWEIPMLSDVFDDTSEPLPDDLAFPMDLVISR